MRSFREAAGSFIIASRFHRWTLRDQLDAVARFIIGLFNRSPKSAGEKLKWPAQDQAPAPRPGPAAVVAAPVAADPPGWLIQEKRGQAASRIGLAPPARRCSLWAWPQGRIRDDMPILVIAFVTLLAVLAFGPMLWIKSVLKRHGVERPDLPGTGAELARHLLDEAGLTDVEVEVAEQGDHYDPAARAVRLLRQHHDGRSIAAVAVAAHEVSHAVQHARSEPAFMARISLIKNLAWLDPIALGIVILAPIVFAFVHVPALMLLQFLVGILLMSIRVVAHFVTLPVELDASFGKALPVLDRGGYLRASDMPAAREVLRAAAWTYVASTLFTLLQIWRWFRP